MTVSEFINKVGFQVDQSSVNAVNSAISGIKGTAMKVLGAIGIGISLSQLNAIAEEFNNINDRINAIVDSSQNAKEVQQSILEAANNCKTSYADMASNVESLYNMNSEVFPIEDATKFVEYVNKIGLAAGYSSGEISSMQSTLQRMISSGEASSTDITRMMRSTPALAKQLADSFGVATSELGTLADAGKITAQTLKEAIFNSTDAIDIAFDGLDYSISDALLNIRNRWGYWVDDINSSLKISETLAKTLVKGFTSVMKVLNTVKNGLSKVNDALGGGNNLFKLIAAAAAAFFAVMTWPTLIAHIKTFVSWFTKAGKLFKLSTAGVLALIAVIVVLFLIVDDFINFMKGNDSVIGYCFQRAGIDAEEMRQKIINIWNNLKTFFVGIWNSMKAAMEPVINWIKKKLEDVFGDDLFAGLGTGMEAVINFLERITSVLANNTGLQDAIGKIIVGFAGIAAAVKVGTVAFGAFKTASNVVEKVAGVFKKAKGAADGSGDSSGSGKGFAGKISDFFEGFANIKTSKILKAVANMAIVIGALTMLAAGIMAVSPYLASLTDASSLIETLATITAVGIIGTALTKLSSMVGNIPVSQVAKGVANIAIVMSALTALAAVVTASAFALESISNPRQTTVLMATIIAVGVIGTALTKVSSLVGNIPVSQVAKGIANIAIVMSVLTVLAAAITAVAYALSGISDPQQIAILIVTITAVGLIGTALSALAGLIGNIPVSKVVKGVANIAIAMAGFTVLAVAITAVSAALESISNPQQIATLLATITAVGLIGTALAACAGIIGIIPVALIVNGLADIAVAITGFTAIAEAYGALSKIPGFNELLSSGFEALSTLANGLGNFVGSLIGGIGEGISNSLPAIGANLSLFAENLSPFFAICGGTDLSGVSTFLEAFSSFILKMTANDLLSFFTGGLDLSDIAKQLSDFASEASIFFMMVATFPEEGFTKATALFESLEGMGNLMKSGGIVQGFTGEVDLGKIADGLASLANDSIAAFYDMVSGLDEEAFSKATSFFESLSGMGDLLKSGGVAQWWSGEVDFEKISQGLSGLTDDSVTAFYSMVADIDEGVFSKATSLFESLSGMGDLLKSGGISQWFGGEVDFGKITSGLSAMTNDGVKSFFTMVEDLKSSTFSKAKEMFQALADMGNTSFKEINTDKIDGNALSDFAGKINRFFSTVENFTSSAFSKAKEMFQALSDISNISLGSIDTSSVDGDALTSFATNIKGFFDAVSEIDPSVLVAIEEAIKNFTTAIIEASSSVGEAASSIQGAIVPVFESMNDTVITVTDSIKTAMIDAWNEAKEATEKSFKEIGSAMETQLNNGKSLVISACNSIKTEMVNVFNGVATSFNSIGVNIMQGLVNGINSGKSSVVTAMTNAVKSAVTAAKDEAGVASPSKKFRDEVGRYFPEGLAVGIKDNAGAVTNAVSQMIGGLTDGGKEVFSSAVNGMKAMASAGTVSMNTAATATGGSTNNSRNIYQNVEISNTFNGDKAGQQKSAKAMNKAADDSTALLARGLAYAR